MNALILTLIAAAALAQEKPLPDTGEGGRTYFEKLYRNRETITSGNVEYTVTSDIDTRHRDLAGSVRTYRLWFDKDRRRMDLKEDRPNDLANALSTRYSYDGKTHRIIDVDRPNFCVREYTNAYLAGKEPSGVPVLTGHMVDPRLIGIVGMEYGFLHAHVLDEFKKIDPNAEFHVSRVQGLGRDATQISVHHPNGCVESRVVPANSLLPIKMTTKFAKISSNGKPLPDIRVEVESDVASWPNPRGVLFEFPRTVKIRRITDGEVESAETIAVRVVKFNTAVDPSDLTWKALRPARGASFMYNDEYKRTNTMAVKWDGEKFAAVPARPLSSATVGLEPGPGESFRLASYIVLGVAALLATILFFVKVFRGRTVA